MTRRIETPRINCDPIKGDVCVDGLRRPRGQALVAIDLFAGAGGFTEGAERAGTHVSFAINHSRPAIGFHSLNHPHTTHCCEDVFTFDFVAVRPILEKSSGVSVPHLVLASPSCKVHSLAASARKAGRVTISPHEDRLRASPEAIKNAVWKVYVEARHLSLPMPFLVVENVPEFRNWELYENWKDAFRYLGYHPGREYVLQALDFGVAAERARLFVIFTPLAVSRVPFDLELPKPVLGRRKKWTPSVKLPKRNHLGRHLVRDHGKAPEWRATSSLSPIGRRKFAENLKRLRTRLGVTKTPPYWTYSYHTGTNPRLVDHPQRTITAEMGGQLYVVHSKGNRHDQRLAYPEELRAWFGLPSDYLVPDSPSVAGQLIGNGVVPAVSEHIVRQLLERA